MTHEAEPRPPHFYQTALAASALAAVAGYVNALTVAGALHIGTTHMTGITTRLSVDLADARADHVTLDLSLLFAFILGAAISGAVLDSTRLRLGRRYGVLLMIEAGILTISLALHDAHILLQLAPLALAAGLQNAMATQYSRAVVRTTHMTGVLTDIGIAIGKALSRRGVTGWRLFLYLGLVLGFAVGGVFGALGHGRFGHDALILPIALTGGGGLVYFVARIRWMRRAGRDAATP
ncbi:MAG TPA: YoaK family protein [Myxococcota bacterium]|nr:YoaK family protein [Myxococcota bacterium]